MVSGLWLGDEPRTRTREANMNNDKWNWREWLNGRVTPGDNLIMLVSFFAGLLLGVILWA
jgi:hypothetical protein